MISEKDVLPLLLDEGKKLMAYPFEGYWKDVGTVKSLWEANMDLLRDETSLNLNDRDWRIYSVNPNEPPQYIAEKARVEESLINEGCVIEGDVKHSVLFQGVTVEEGSMVIDSVVMPGAKIGKNVVIERAIVGSEMVIEDGTIIRPEKNVDDVVLIAEGK